MKNADLQRLYHQTKNELLAFRNELKKLSVSNYPTELGQGIIKELQEKTDKYDELLSKRINEVEENEKDQKIVDQCKKKINSEIHVPLVSQSIKFLNWLYKAQTKRVPWSFVNCVEKLGKQVIPDKQILICCDDFYNYGICWAKDAKIAPYPYYIISLPLLHRTNILWHSLIGHELFHPRCSEFIDKHNKTVLISITKEISSNTDKYITPNKPEDLFAESEKKQRIDNLAGIIHFAWKRGLEEILCDMACVEMFGPAALLAMRAFSAYSPENSIPEPENNFYPSWQYRLEIVWENFIDEQKIEELITNIKDKEISKSFKSEIDKIKVIANKKEGDKLVKNHKHAKLAYTKIDNILKAAVKFVKDTMSPYSDKWYKTEVLGQVPGLIKRLENGIPPNEVIEEISSDEGKYSSKPANLTALFIAGWVYECYWQEKKCNQDDDIMTYQTMSRLLLKACEDIEIISRIQNVSSNKKSDTD